MKNSIKLQDPLANYGDWTKALILPRAKAGKTPLHLATLSWSMWGADEDCNDQSPDSFLHTLQRACHRAKPQDLVLCSGMTVTTPPPAQAVLNASKGAAVLYEAVSGGSMLLAWRGHDGTPRGNQLRNRQILFRHNDPASRFKETAETVAQEQGVLRFDGVAINFVVLVCGENNLLGGGLSVFKNRAVSIDRSARLAALLKAPWALLNPAHRPYFPQIASTGFAKVGHVNTPKYEAGPTIGKLTERERPFRDGTTAPAVVLHANNFSLSCPETTPYASVAFGNRVTEVGVRVQGKIPGSTGRAPRSWLLARYAIAV